MAMSSYEVVRCAIEFDGPDRLPVRFDTLGLTDVLNLEWNQIVPWDRNDAANIDEWGCLWARSGMGNMGQVKGHPLADWSALDRYRWPDADDPRFYEGMEEALEGHEDKYVCTKIFMLLFERMHALRGFENTLVDLIMERKKTVMLADRIVEFNLAIIENLARRFPGIIHGLWFTEDWGTQQSLMIHPDLWREFFKPRYQRLFDAIHEAGWHVWMHSDGRINLIMGDLIEIGVDVINLQQPRVLGIEEVGRQFRGRICFEALCDIQHTLPFKGLAEIRDEAQSLLEHWATPGGGFILADYGDPEAIGVPLKKKRMMLDAFIELDPWKPTVTDRTAVYARHDRRRQEH